MLEGMISLDKETITLEKIEFIRTFYNIIKENSKLTKLDQQLVTVFTGDISSFLLAHNIDPIFHTAVLDINDIPCSEDFRWPMKDILIPSQEVLNIILNRLPSDIPVDPDNFEM